MKRLLIILTFIILPQFAYADTPYTNFTPGTVRNNYGDYVGFKFTVGATPIHVTQLGRYILSTHSQTHPIKITANGNQTALATCSVDASLTSPGNFGYCTLSSPLTLNANTTYVILSLEYSGGDTWYDADSVLGPPYHVDISAFPGAVYQLSGGLNDAGLGTYRSYVPVNFVFTSERIYLTNTAATTWTVPSDWNNASNTIEVIGGGAGSGPAVAGVGGGGGAYSKAVNVSLTPGATVNIAVGAGGATSTPGGDTYLCNSTSNCADITGSAVVVGAKGGFSTSSCCSGTTNPGGAAASGVGSTKYSGGDATGAAGCCDSAAGGGAAGPNGNGGSGAIAGGSLNVGGGGGAGGGGTNGTSGAGGFGAGGTGSGGSGNGGNGGGLNTSGADGGAGTEWNPVYGSGGGGGGCGGSNDPQHGGSGGLYGGGGANCYNNAPTRAVGLGAQGIIVITYTPADNTPAAPAATTTFRLIIDKLFRLVGKLIIQ